MILDSDLAAIYGVTTKALNQAISCNADRFPPDFVFRLTAEEIMDVRSQSLTSSGAGNRSSMVVASVSDANRSQLKQSSTPSAS